MCRSTTRTTSIQRLRYSLTLNHILRMNSSKIKLKVAIAIIFSRQPRVAARWDAIWGAMLANKVRKIICAR